MEKNEYCNTGTISCHTQYRKKHPEYIMMIMEFVHSIMNALLVNDDTGKKIIIYNKN